MRHGQHGDNSLARMVREMRIAEIVGIGECVVGEHHSLGIARGARGIIDDGQVGGIVIRIRHIIGRKTVGMMRSESPFPVLPCLGHPLIAVPEQASIPHIDGRFQGRHHLRCHLLPYILIDKEHHTIRMVGERGDIVRVEVGQQRHRHASADIDAPEAQRPSGRITGTDDDFIPLVDTRLMEEDAETLNVLGQVGISEAFALIIAERLLVPLFPDRFLQFFQIVFH